MQMKIFTEFDEVVGLDPHVQLLRHHQRELFHALGKRHAVDTGQVLDKPSEEAEDRDVCINGFSHA